MNTKLPSALAAILATTHWGINNSRELSERDKAQRSPELVAELKAKAEAKQKRKAEKRKAEKDKR